MGSNPTASPSSKSAARRPPRASFERRVIRFAFLLALPGISVSVILVWLLTWSLESKVLLLGAEALACLLIGAALHEHIIRPLQTLANVVGALREDDYSFRARLATPNDALGELSIEVNALADLLAQHRTGVIEATALLQRVVEEVDVPIFAFDSIGTARLVNSAAARMFKASPSDLIGKTALDLGLQSTLTCENESLLNLDVRSDVRWLVRRSQFRQNGLPHNLVVLSDVSRALREEERRAWQRLIRVIGHELNNSLAPIKSIAGSLNARLSEVMVEGEQRRDFRRGLEIIEDRSASLNRFLQAYRQLAQMPPPAKRSCTISRLVTRVADLERRVPVAVLPGLEIEILADPDQLEQMLINLLRNAADAVLEKATSSTGPKPPTQGDRPSKAPITFTWSVNNKEVSLLICDSGSGLTNPGNTFVPFYTTKPQGSGIGLVLSRQICEAHGGSLELSNRSDSEGCLAKVTLPRTVAGDLKLADLVVTR
ncbi:MAG TPA: ATP-binding protein [Candidatus Sulfotelmatobacter sp.]|nr:ATP-binding protein [Candidatus Sulfotelmatobacter sp.]